MSKDIKHWIVSIVAILLLLGLFIVMNIFLGACRSTKTEVRQADSFSKMSSYIASHTQNGVTASYAKDTAIGISGAVIYAEIGKDTVIKKNNTTLTIRGKYIECRTDSLTAVITNLKRENTYLKDSSVAMSSQLEASKQVTKELKEIVKGSAAGVLDKVLDWIKSVLAGFGLIFLIKILIKRAI